MTTTTLSPLDRLTAQLDLLEETRTEDRHPVPELVVWLAEQGFEIRGIDPLQFADEAFDLFERLRVTDVTVARFDADADPGLRPERTYAAVESISEQAHSDLTVLVAAHLTER